MCYGGHTYIEVVCAFIAGPEQAAAVECAAEPLQGGALPGGGPPLQPQAEPGPAGQAQQGGLCMTSLLL